jgi:hypothetical protein
LLSERFFPRYFLPLLLIPFAACANQVDDFTAGRALDPCSGTNYGLCNGVAGCILDDTNYIQGHFPGQEEVLVRTIGPATIEVHFLLQNVTSSGMQTLITWYEPGCISRNQIAVPGDVFVGESERDGEFTRSYDLLAAGDHEVSYQSDANGDYYFKVVVVPK